MCIHRLQHALLLCATLATATLAQNNPVYVDESPTAAERIKQIDLMAGPNPQEAATLLQSLLEDAGGQLLPLPDAPTRFSGIRTLLLQRLQSDPALLAAWRNQFTRTAEDALAERALEEVERRWPLTRSGLLATIELGQRDLELAAFKRGAGRMRRGLDHPDADDDTDALAWLGIAMAAAAGGDDATHEEAITALEALGPAGEPMLAAIEAWSFSGPARSVDTTHHTDIPADMDTLDGLSIWSSPLEHSLLLQRYGSPLRMSQSSQGGIENAVTSGWFTTAMPARYGDLVFLNLGQHVIAFDALTGLQRWEHVHRVQDITLDPSQRPSGANDIEAEGRSIVTATGIDYGDERAGDGAILCLDAPTGHLRWSVVLDNHPDIESSAGMFPCSAPVVHEGIVYVLARMITPQRLHSESVIAIDLADGRVLWSRWIASSARTRNHTARPVVRPEPIDDSIVVRSGSGAIAALDASTGDLRWLHRLDTPLDGTKNLRARPYTAPRSIQTNEGVLVVAPNDTVLFHLDPHSGAILDQHLLNRSEALNAPLYLLGGGERVYAIGEDLRCFDSTSIGAPIWTRAWSDTGTSIMPSGRIQLLQDTLLVPLPDRVLEIDAMTGSTLRSLPISAPGNILLADDRLVVASPTQLETYTAFEQAELALRNRIADDPDDVELRMDLVRLAARAGNDELLIQSGGDALDLMDIVATPDDVHGRLLEHFITAIRQQRIEVQTGDQIAGLMRRTARNAEQRLDIELALGDYWSVRQPERASFHWLTVLQEPALRDAWHTEGDIHARGAAWARRRLAALQGDFDVPALWVDQDDSQSIGMQLAAMRANLRWTSEVDRLSKALPAVLDRLHQAGRSEAAAALLQGWRQRYDGTTLRSGDAPWTPPAPVQLGSEPGTTSATTQRIAARHVAPSPSSIAEMDNDLVVVLKPDVLQGIDARTFETRWTQPTTAIFGNLLQSDAERMTLLLADRDGTIMLHEIDPRTGAHLGGIADIAAAFEEPAAQSIRLQPILPDGRMINMNDILAVANNAMVGFVRRDGAALVLEGPVSEATRQRVTLPVRVVHDLDVWPDGFVAVGPSTDSPQSIAVSNANPVLVHVDAASGDAHEIEWPEMLGRALWIERSSLDDLILGGERGVALIPHPDREAVWMNTDPDLHYTRKGWATGETLLMLDAKDQLIRLDLASGIIDGPIDVPRHRALGALKKVQEGPLGLQILREGALALHDPQGIYVGTDSLPGSMQHEHLIRNDGEYLLLSYLQSISRDQTGSRTSGRQHLYRVHRLDATGRLIDLFDLYPLQSRIRATRSLGSGLLLETDSAIELIPLPDDSVQ